MYAVTGTEKKRDRQKITKVYRKKGGYGEDLVGREEKRERTQNEEIVGKQIELGQYAENSEVTTKIKRYVEQ